MDLTAAQTSKLLGLNRNTINRYFNIFRQAIYHCQLDQFKQFIGEVEIDESYFGPKRVKGQSTKRGRGIQWLRLVDVFRNREIELEITFPEVKRVFEMLGSEQPIFAKKRTRS